MNTTLFGLILISIAIILFCLRLTKRISNEILEACQSIAAIVTLCGGILFLFVGASPNAVFSFLPVSNTPTVIQNLEPTSTAESILKNTVAVVSTNTPVPPTDIPLPAYTSTSVSTSTPQETATSIPATNTSVPTDKPTEVLPTSTPDCWTTVFSFNPSGSNDIAFLSSARPGFIVSFDPNVLEDGAGSLRIETSNTTLNNWSWAENTNIIEAKDGKYRITAWIKTQNAAQSHIAIVGRNASGKDVYKNDTDQISVIPSTSFNGTTEWTLYSREFNPIQWDATVKNIVVGINAGWSLNGQPSITWFDNIQLQYCAEVSVLSTDMPLPVSPSSIPIVLPEICLAPAEVESWCDGGLCKSERFEQLQESNGVINPCGVKLKTGAPLAFNIPVEIVVDVWDCFKHSQATGPTRIPQVCEASFRRFHSTDTVVSVSATQAVIVKATDVIPKIRGEDGEMQKILSWWREDTQSNKDGELNPTSLNINENCFGIVWNTKEYGYHKVVVFQFLKAFTFSEGGWYVKVCNPTNIQISSEDVGKIQADWLSKRYQIDIQPWEVIVLSKE